MFNIITKNNSVLENKKSKTLLYTIATLVTLTFSSGSNEVYAINLPESANQVQNVGKRSISKFTPEEDEQLKNLVSQYGTGHWADIAESMPWRNRKQLRQRYVYYLDPNIKIVPWTEEEDRLLIDKQKEYGNKWAKIATFFDGRTYLDLRHRSELIKRRKLDEDNNLDEFYSRKPKQLIQQSDQIDELALPAQEVNSDTDTDVQEIFVQNTIDDSNQSLSSKPHGSSLIFPDLSFLLKNNTNTTNIIYINK